MFKDNYHLALSRLLKLSVPSVKEVAGLCHRQAKNHQRRCEGLARMLVCQHEKAITQAPDATWMPPCFEQYCADWINTNVGD